MKTAITTTTLTEFQNLCKRLDKNGYTWPGGTPLFNRTQNEIEYNLGMRVIIIDPSTKKATPALNIKGIKNAKKTIFAIIKSDQYLG